MSAEELLSMVGGLLKWLAVQCLSATKVLCLIGMAYGSALPCMYARIGP